MCMTHSLSRSAKSAILATALSFATGAALGCGPEEGIGENDAEAQTVTQALTVSPGDPVVVAYDDLDVNVPTRFNIPYTGAGAAAFPDGLPLSIGSGLRFRRGGPFGISSMGSPTADPTPTRRPTWTPPGCRTPPRPS